MIRLNSDGGDNIGRVIITRLYNFLKKITHKALSNV